MSHDLKKYPSPQKITVQGLIDWVRAGVVRVPRFQRSFRWKLEDVELLIDSIVRGYPIGTFLFWKRSMPAETVSLGAVNIDVPERSDALLVVDGQQRISALVSVLLPPKIAEHARREYKLDWDLSSDRVVRSSAPVSPNTVRLPLDRAVDAADLNEWALDSGLAREEIRRVFELARIIREYEFLGYVVEADDEAVLRRIFARANTSGKRLRADEVFNAINGRRTDSSPHDLTTLSDAVDVAGFGVIERRWLHQAALAVAGIDSTAHGAAKAEVPQRTFSDTADALRRTIVFLLENADIPMASLVPYGLVFPILAAFFSRHPEPNDRSRELLSRWVWRGAITGAHRGADIPERRESFRAISDDEEGTVQALLKLVPKERKNLQEHGRLNRKDANARLWMLVLVAMGPRDFATGDPSDVPKLLARTWTKLPKLFPSHLDSGEVLIPKVLANRVLSATPLDSVWRDAAHLRRVAPSHGLTVPTLELTVQGEVRQAIEVRSNDLRKLALQMVESHARWEDSDRPSIGYITSYDDA